MFFFLQNWIEVDRKWIDPIHIYTGGTFNWIWNVEGVAFYHLEIYLLCIVHTHQ